MDIQDTELTNEYSETKEAPEKENLLEKLFEQKTITLEEIMLIPNLRECLNEMDDQFSDRLLEEQELLKEIIDCALRPHKLEGEVKIQWPYRAVEFFTKQQEGFYKRLFLRKSMEVEGEEEDKENSRGKAEPINLLLYLFKILQEPIPINETSAGYLLQMFNQLYYPNQQECFYLFVDFDAIFMKAATHFYNHSVQELLWRVIDTYNEDVKSKTELMNRLFRAVLGQTERVQEYLQSLHSIVDNLAERCEEVNTKRVSSLLFQAVINLQNLGLIAEAAKRYSDNKNALKFLSLILMSFIRLYLPAKPQKKKMYYMDDEFELGKVSEEIGKELVLTTNQILSFWFSGISKENAEKQNLDEALRLLHQILLFDPNSCETIVNEEYIHLIPLLFKREPNNNILHNQIKYSLLLILKNPKSSSLIGSSLIQFILESYSKELAPKPTYLNQLYHLIPLIEERVKDWALDEQLFSNWMEFDSNQYQSLKHRYETEWSKLTMSPAKKSFQMQQQLLSSDEISLQQARPFKKLSDSKQVLKIPSDQQNEQVQTVLKVEYSPTLAPINMEYSPPAAPAGMDEVDDEGVVGAGTGDIENSPQ